MSDHKEERFVMKITTPQDGEVYYLDGIDRSDAVAAFGEDADIELGHWTPIDKET